MVATSSLARLQQALIGWVLAWALGWWWVMWPAWPILSWVGALLIPLGFSGVLAAEFWMLRVIARGDSVPAATPGELLGAWASETLMNLRVFGWRQPFGWRALPDQLHGPGLQGRTGVVFIHGLVCNRGFWTPWLDRLRADRRAFVALNLEPVWGDMDNYLPQVQQAVDQVRQASGLPPLIVCHSMGGVVVRAWLQTQTGEEVIAHIVTIGSPHAGTWLAHWSPMAQARQMRPGSPWLLALHKAWTPHWAARFTCWYSNCDNIVMPPSTATLPGADNRLVRGAPHVGLAFQAQVMDHTMALLADLPGGDGIGLS